MDNLVLWKTLAKKIDADDRAELKREINKLHKLLTDCAHPLGDEWEKTPLYRACDLLEDALYFLSLAVESKGGRQILIRERQP